jgi:2-oxoglutarate dehydrogenase complex dehydrogenase (E1) component-like enzyme
VNDTLSKLQEEPERTWFAEAFERVVQQPVHDQEKVRSADLLVKCDTFDNFMQVRYSSVKRYGAEVNFI